MNIKSIIKRLLQAVQPTTVVHANIQVLQPSDYLKGRVALITGGTSGIGYAIAKAYLNAGANVIITGRTDDRLVRACNELSITSMGGGKCKTLVLDNQDVASIPAKIKNAVSLFGRIDILVNNAGVLGGYISNSTESEYDAVLDTNLKGVFFLSKEIGHYFKDNNIKGNILNIASSSSLRPAASAYTISKWGIRGLTLGLAKVLAPYDITVNGIAPGQTATPMLRSTKNLNNIAAPKTPIGRFALPEEIANMAVIMVSDMGRLIMGDIVYMTGGVGNLTNEDLTWWF